MNEARKQWFLERVSQVHASVSAYDVLRHNGIELKQSSDDTEEQISCPFHGADRKPSARIYPGEDGKPSHVWCFVCQKPHWDVIGLWRMFNGGPENCSFGQALSGLEKQYGLKPPDAPTGEAPESVKPLTEDAQHLDSFKRMYITCEHRLLSCLPAFKYLKDMHGYLAIGSALDKIKFRIDTNAWPPSKGLEVLTALMDKIREKVRDCPEDGLSQLGRS